jgi:hypothetical protein
MSTDGVYVTVALSVPPVAMTFVCGSGRTLRRTMIELSESETPALFDWVNVTETSLF